jgi:SAM-dependent methyltransferase
MLAEPMVEVRCAVCGSGRREVICAAREVRAQLEYLRRFHRRRLRADAGPEALEERAEFTQDYATDIVACRGCGLVFRSPRPAAGAIARAYAAERHGRRRLEALFESQAELYRPKARRLARRLSPGARVVEVGSFVGGFLAAGREQGWEMLGVDPGEEVDAFCAERGLRVFRGSLAEAPLESGSVDAVAIWNTFDQLPDPEPVLAAARRLLRPGGLLAVRVPNGECFRWAACWMQRLPHPLGGWLRAAMAWNNLLVFPYLNGYSLPTLGRLLARHGFQRLCACPDTLARLSDEQTQRWAAWEERALKLVCHLAARVEALRPGSRLSLAPWVDAIYAPLRSTDP